MRTPDWEHSFLGAPQKYTCILVQHICIERETWFRDLAAFKKEKTAGTTTKNKEEEEEEQQQPQQQDSLLKQHKFAFSSKSGRNPSKNTGSLVSILQSPSVDAAIIATASASPIPRRGKSLIQPRWNTELQHLGNETYKLKFLGYVSSILPTSRWVMMMYICRWSSNHTR